MKSKLRRSLIPMAFMVSTVMLRLELRGAGRGGGRVLTLMFFFTLET